jgi:nanoRNase/pAp phosphatase (c-di-AMP/oligoRNAs hydrolase)
MYNEEKKGNTFKKLKTNNKKLIVYHDDLDGYLSAISYAILDSKNYLDVDLLDLLNNIDKENKEQKEKEEEILEYIYKYYDFFYVDHDQYNILQKLETANFNIDNYNSFILVDFSDTFQIMSYLKNKFKENFIWIDHHKRAYESFKDKLDIKGTRDHNYSASRLVWKFFNKECPILVRYAEDMDIWKWNLENSKSINIILALNYSKFAVETNNSYFLKLLNNKIFNKNKDNFILEGNSINKYIKNESKRTISKGKRIDFENYKTFIVNSQQKAGDLCDLIFNSPEYKDVDIVFVWNRVHKNNFDKVSLRSKNEKVDVSKIAEKYGGNGHTCAAGFVIDNIDEII